MNQRTLKRFLIVGIVALSIVLATSFTGMFWDNVTQIYSLSNWLYMNGLFHFEMPNTFDPGVPPTIPFLNALGWTLFGKTLFVSHMLMWPFVFGLLWQLFRLVDYYIEEKKYLWWVYVLVVADPSLCSMMTLINYEVIQYFLFFGAINSLLRGQNQMKTIFLVFLGLVSLRSMMLCASVFFFDVAIFVVIRKRSIREISFKHHILPYVIGAIPAMTFLIWHYSVKGWVFGNADSPWAECGTMVNGIGFLRNIIVINQRFFDFGRIFLWITFGIIVLRYWRYQSFVFAKSREVGLLWISAFILIGGVSLMINNPMGHRYFIANYVIFSLLTSIAIIRFVPKVQKLFGVLICLLLIGNLWLYPTRISQGWDSSLGHLPYWHLRREMIKDMEQLNVSVDSTASFFPNYCPIEAIDLNGDDRSFNKFDGCQKYVLMSNVYNLSDEDYDILDSKYHVIHQLSFYPVRVMLYQKNRD